MEKFENVCVAMMDAKMLEEKTNRVYEILKHYNTPMRAKDIAKLLYNTEYAYPRVVKALGWLVRMGLIERYEIDGEPIVVEPLKGHWEYPTCEPNPYLTIIDGEAYIKLCDRTDYEEWNYQNRKGEGVWVYNSPITITPKIAMFKLA